MPILYYPILLCHTAAPCQDFLHAVEKQELQRAEKCKPLSARNEHLLFIAPSYPVEFGSKALKPSMVGASICRGET